MEGEIPSLIHHLTSQALKTLLKLCLTVREIHSPRQGLEVAEATGNGELMNGEVGDEDVVGEAVGEVVEGVGVMIKWKTIWATKNLGDLEEEGAVGVAEIATHGEEVERKEVIVDLGVETVIEAMVEGEVVVEAGEQEMMKGVIDVEEIPPKTMVTEEDTEVGKTEGKPGDMTEGGKEKEVDGEEIDKKINFQLIHINQVKLQRKRVGTERLKQRVGV